MMYFMIKQPTAAHHYNNSSKFKYNFKFFQISLLLAYCYRSARNIFGTILYYVIAVTHFTVVCDACTINLPNCLVCIIN